MNTTVIYDFFNVQSREERELRPYSVEELEKLIGFTYQPTLCFATPSVYSDVLQACQTGRLAGELSVRQKWCGVFHREAIASGTLSPGLFIRWINPIVGYGVFTDRPIPAQGYIGSYTGEIKRRSFWSKKGNDYCFSYSHGGFKTPFFIDAQQKGGLARFINHSDWPNLETIPVMVEGVMHIILCAICPIAKGAQLTYDYGEKYWSKRDDPSICHP